MQGEIHIIFKNFSSWILVGGVSDSLLECVVWKKWLTVSVRNAFVFKFHKPNLYKYESVSHISHSGTGEEIPRLLSFHSAFKVDWLCVSLMQDGCSTSRHHVFFPAGKKVEEERRGCICLEKQKFFQKLPEGSYR